ncbi:MAG TPA: hypothetical protein P5323_03565 [Candidatus Moranbacteria bacterium]|nr:hypothetical protein [Candidatus Moranbacteria bacterium]HRY28190.1 hypothetical protein [Candidatus Moranbacteria bacterium]HSA08558.1 hypothetical protein [Candidatus Moranbacteria bacterium]
MVEYTFFSDLEMVGRQRFCRKVLPTKKAADGSSKFAEKIVGLDCIGVPMPEKQISQKKAAGQAMDQGVVTKRWFYSNTAKRWFY